MRFVKKSDATSKQHTHIHSCVLRIDHPVRGGEFDALLHDAQLSLSVSLEKHFSQVTNIALLSATHTHTHQLTTTLQMEWTPENIYNVQNTLIFLNLDANESASLIWAYVGTTTITRQHN
jgi:hypothetical protein